MSARTSADDALERFNTHAAAVKYAASLGGTATHRREVRCILSAFAGLPRGASVLDLPCGTGRLLGALAGASYRITEADSSPYMVSLARAQAMEEGIDLPETAFAVASVFETGFPDRAFDAVVCNRLLHHFREPDVRRRALRELARVTRGPIVASFFTSRSLDAMLFRVRQIVRGKPAADRIPISPRVLEQDACATGLRVRRWMATRPGISKQCYAVLEKVEA
jgi:SAM-dependent methyltransferase